MDLFAPNLPILAILGITFAYFGLGVCLLVILPHQIREVKNDSIRNIRISLPITNFLIILIFSYLTLDVVLRLLYRPETMSLEGNMNRFLIGSGVGLFGMFQYIIYKKGGEMEK